MSTALCRIRAAKRASSYAALAATSWPLGLAGIPNPHPASVSAHASSSVAIINAIGFAMQCLSRRICNSKQAAQIVNRDVLFLVLLAALMPAPKAVIRHLVLRAHL